MTSPSILFHGDIRGEKTFYNNLNELYRNIFFIRNKNKRTKKKKKPKNEKTTESDLGDTTLVVLLFASKMDIFFLFTVPVYISC